MFVWRKIKRNEKKTAISKFFSLSLIQFKEFSWSKALRLSPEVEDALRIGRATVALESTIISHGMPYPENFQMANAVEQLVRAEGAVPATIGVADGRLCVGMGSDLLERFSRLGHEVRKCSTRDLALACTQRVLGATTVASTMVIAEKAGIDVFATGGIGGVHRGGEITMDISADLRELGRTPVTVVCAGVKSILDIGKTLEYLETEGVPVIGYGTDEFPAFFSPSSGFKAPLRCNTPEEIAEAIATGRLLGLKQGMLVAVPNPIPMEGENIEAAIQQALIDAEKKSVTGKDITPFILREVNKHTKGASLASNLALVKNNVRIGAKIAVALANLRASTPLQQKHAFHTRSRRRSQAVKRDGAGRDSIEKPIKAVVVGGAVQDSTGKPLAGGTLNLHTSNPGTVVSSFGGVGRNIAEVLVKLGAETTLISAVGNDIAGKALLADCLQKGIKCHGIKVQEGFGTAFYSCVMDSQGDLHTAVADTGILDTIDDLFLEPFLKELAEANVVIADANISNLCLRKLGEICVENSVPFVYEPVSQAKACKAVHAGALPLLTAITPNFIELKEIYKAMSQNEIMLEPEIDNLESIFRSCLELAVPVVRSMQAHKPQDQHQNITQSEREKHVLCTLGKHGALLISSRHPGEHETFYFPAQTDQVLNTTGAGDSMAAAFSFGIASGKTAEQSLWIGTQIAKETVECAHTLPASYSVIKV